jgi:hypothetical protein
MSTSGSVNFTLDRNALIKKALELIGVYDVTDTNNADDISSASDNLNLIVKEMMAEGIDLPIRKVVTLFLTGEQEYSLGSGSTDHFTESHLSTTLTADATTAVLTVTSSTGMTAADYALVVLDDGTLFTSTIASVDSATQITLDDTPTSTASSGNYVFTYTTKANRPQRIFSPFRRANDSSNDIPIDVIGYADYARLTPKDQAGAVNQIHYNPSQGTGKLYVWPIGNADFKRIVFLSESPIEDFDNSTDNPYFPVEWFNTLVWRLASELAFVHDIPREKRESIYQKAMEKSSKLLAYDSEQGDLRFSFDTRDDT